MDVDVLIAGSAPSADESGFYAGLLSASRVVIACDAAAEWCVALGRRPDIAIGDFDSATQGAPERLEALGVDVRRFSAEKDESDLDLALAAARSLGAASVTFTAAFTGRLDHTLAALGTAGAAADMRARIEEPAFRAWVLSRRGVPDAVIRCAPGATVSLVALAPCTGVSLSGLRYRLEDAALEPLSSLGISNVALEAHVRVTLAEGTLVVIASRNADVNT